MRKISYLPHLYLLVILIPLLFALRWVAAKFPMSSFDTSPEVRYIEPAKVALLSYRYYERHRYDFSRVFLLDFEKETINEIECPSSAGAMWNSFVGIDMNGMVVCRVRSTGGFAYYRCDPRTGKTILICRTSQSFEFIGNRFLCKPGYDSVGPSFTWYDLAKSGHTVHTQNLDTPTDFPVAVPRSNAFYYIALELPDRQVDPEKTLVLMRMSETGPIETARWSVVGGSGYVTYQVGDGCIGCLSLDRKTIDIHDAETGAIRLQFPVPAKALGAGNRPDSWTMFDSFVSLGDGLGAATVYNTKTGRTLDVSGSWGGRLLGYQGDEYLTIHLKNWPKDWPGSLEIRNANNGELLHQWPTPVRNVNVMIPRFAEVTFSPSGKEILLVTNDGRVLFADKASGKILRTIQPRFWIPFASFFVALATLVWIICWIRFSIRAGTTYWLDECIILGVVALFLYWRMMLSGFYEDYHRPVWQCTASMLIAFATFAIHQRINLRHSFYYRTLPSIAFVSILFIAVQTTLPRGWWVNAVITRMILFGCVLLLGSVVTNRFCPPLGNKIGIERRKARFRLSLRGILLLTIYCALTMVALRWMDLRICFDVMMREGLGIAIYGIISLIAYYLTHSRGLIWLKSLLAIALAVSIFVLWKYQDDLWSWNGFSTFSVWTVAVAQMAIATILLALPILMRHNSLLSPSDLKNEEILCV